MIEEFIPEGYENRISRGELVDIIHVPDRQIRRQISEAQQRGVLIISCDGGYFQAEEKDEPYVAEYVAQERHRFSQQAKKLKAIAKAWRGDPEEIPGQMSFEW